MRRISKKTRTIFLICVCLISVIALFYLGVKGNVIYYYQVSEAVAKSDSQGQTRFRLAGAVVDGSIKTDGSTTSFKVTDGKKTVDVTHRGDPPELFKDGAPVVCEGKWAKGKEGKSFASDLIMIKHGNEYTPPDVKQDGPTTTFESQ